MKEQVSLETINNKQEITGSLWETTEIDPFYLD